MQSFTIYVGSNNKTHQLELAKIQRILSKRHEGFTISQAIGFWRGEREKTAVVSLASGRLAALATISDLKTELDQESVAYQVAPKMVFA